VSTPLPPITVRYFLGFSPLGLRYATVLIAVTSYVMAAAVPVPCRWGCPPGKFPVKFDARQTCYLLKGKVRAHIKGSSECVEFGAGDLVVFPKGLSCTWDVVAAVDKYYKFDSS